jgi:hypothetical protein
MTSPSPAPGDAAPVIPNGPGAAAILAAGIGALALGILAFAADAVPAIGQAMNFWPPSGALSGVTTIAIVVWLATWFVLARRWATRDLDMVFINGGAFAMVLVTLVLTFPPLSDLLQGR